MCYELYIRGGIKVITYFDKIGLTSKVYITKITIFPNCTPCIFAILFGWSSLFKIEKRIFFIIAVKPLGRWEIISLYCI